MSKEVFAKITNDTIFKIVFTKEQNKNSLLFLLNTCPYPTTYTRRFAMI